MSTMKLATLLSVSLLASAAAFAETSATTANVVGVLRVDSSAKRTIVAVPWVAAGVDAGNIKVTDIVKTSNLTVGDTLSYYNDGTFDTWELVAGTGGAAPAWATVNQVSKSGETGTSEDPAVQTLPRGGALILVRQDATKPFYLQGQYSSATMENQTLANGGSKAAPVYSLIAPPAVQNVDVNTATWANVGANDQLVIQGVDGQSTTCVWREGQWQTYSWVEQDGLKVLQYSKTVPSILAGTGFWFVSQTSGETQPTVRW